jgi:myo-inositol 2-dehydrogenase/D-chiro-inositol 1-dehydrogenase
MKLALLGIDDVTLAIVRRALETGLHEVVLLVEEDLTGHEPDSMRQLRALLPPRTAEIAWEAMLHDRPADAIIVARGKDEDLRAEQLRKLVQAGVPMLIAHPVVDSMLVYYELDMIRRESNCVIVPIAPWRWHPAVAQLVNLMKAADSPLGAIGQAAFDRTLAVRDKTFVLTQFARDADLIRDTCGDMTRLSALSSSHGESSYANLGVQMSGPGPIVVRWSIGPVEEAPRGALTIVGTRGKATLHMPDEGAWRLETRIDGQIDAESFLKWNMADAALEQLQAAITGDEPALDWTDAARSVELAETIDRSLAKGRTIELHKEDFSDIGTFKGTMTSVGCGLLLTGLIAVLGLGVVEAVARKLGFPGVADALRFWPYWLAGLLVVFLVLQLVLKLAAPAESDQRADREA